ncbi:MAG: type IV pili methyl-accepting chemotaxis transducer N-terminal domain-containing protein [Pontibacterium sp.]
MENKKIHTMICTLLSTLWLLLVSPLSAAEINSPAEAIYKAADLRMLTQRMLKNYALVGMDIRARKAGKELTLSLKQFETQLSELLNHTTDDNTRNHLNEVSSLWEKLKPGYLTSPSKASAEALRTQSETLLQAADKATLSLRAQANPAIGKWVELSGRQAMLSQRITATYALMAWGYEDQYRESYKTSYQVFSQTLKTLEHNPTNSTSINDALETIRRQFNRIKQPSKDNVFVPGLVNRSSDKMLKSINQLTQLYANL